MTGRIETVQYLDDGILAWGSDTGFMLKEEPPIDRKAMITQAFDADLVGTGFRARCVLEGISWEACHRDGGQVFSISESAIPATLDAATEMFRVAYVAFVVGLHSDEKPVPSAWRRDPLQPHRELLGLARDILRGGPEGIAGALEIIDGVLMYEAVDEDEEDSTPQAEDAATSRNAPSVSNRAPEGASA